MTEDQNSQRLGGFEWRRGRKEQRAAPQFSSGEIKWDCGPSARKRRSLGSVICRLTAGSGFRGLHAAVTISLSILASFYVDGQNNAVSTHSNGSPAGSSRGTSRFGETLSFAERKNTCASSFSLTQTDKRRGSLYGQLAQREQLCCCSLGRMLWIVSEKMAAVWNEGVFFLLEWKEKCLSCHADVGKSYCVHWHFWIQLLSSYYQSMNDILAFNLKTMSLCSKFDNHFDVKLFTPSMAFPEAP